VDRVGAMAEGQGHHPDLYLAWGKVRVFQKFQETRLVYITGEHDDLTLHDDLVSRASMRDWCIFNLEKSR
jgi:pterin-4a-carbinolamine dehydratase